MSDNEERNSIDEEPQQERGAPGSRDEGEGLEGGSDERPAGGSEAKDSTGVNPLPPITDTPITGDQGG